MANSITLTYLYHRSLHRGATVISLLLRASASPWWILVLSLNKKSGQFFQVFAALSKLF